MKIVQVNSVCGVGSTGRIATDIHSILKEKGHDSYIAYGRKEPLHCEETIKIGDNKDFVSHVIKSRLFDKHGFGSKKATKEFISRIDKINPDVIHLHNIHGYYLNIEILFEYLKKVDKPVIWTLHDCWAITGHCAYFEYENCKCWEEGGNHVCIQKSSYPASYLINNSKKNYFSKKDIFSGVKNLTIVTPSKWLANIIKKSFLKDYPVKVVNNGIDLSLFYPSKSNDFRINYGLEDTFIILGVASVWDRRKGLAYFLKLAESLSSDERIVLVGLSEKQQRSLPNNIICINRTNSTQELAEIYSSADVFLNPTLEDNFPTTNLESLACGTPVVTFNTGGSPESLDNSCGIIVDKKESNELYIALMKIKNTKYKKEDCVKRALNYDKKIKFYEYIKLYNEVLI